MRPLPQLGEHESSRIAQYAIGALRGAGVERIVPTPLDEIALALQIHSIQDLFQLGGTPPGWAAERFRRLRKLLGALDIRERTIYVDFTQPEERRRFTLGHELGHQALPGHPQQLHYADDSTTLSPDVEDLLEAEANQFSAELLFQGGYFTDMAAGARIGLGVPLELAPKFRVSRHATIRRYAETSPQRCALAIFGRYQLHQEGGTYMKVLRALESPSFRERYGPLEACLPSAVSIAEPFGADALASIRRERDPIISGTTRLETSRGRVEMNYELVSNFYTAFALIYPTRRFRLGSRIVVEDIANAPGT